MDRITEKLKQASGVAPRVAGVMEAEADKLIAREAELAQRTQAAFKPHHAVLDARKRELDQLEDALQIVSNADPLEGSGSTSGEAAAKPAGEFHG